MDPERTEQVSGNRHSNLFTNEAFDNVSIKEIENTSDSTRIIYGYTARPSGGEGSAVRGWGIPASLSTLKYNGMVYYSKQ